MYPFSVVEDFNAIKYATRGFGPTQVPVMIHPFSFKQVEETFRNSVIPADPLAAHAASKTMLGKQYLIIARSVLTAFLTPNVLDTLVKNFDIKPITTAEEDLKAILG